MCRCDSFVRFSSISAMASSGVMEVGSSGLGMETKRPSKRTKGPKRPVAATISLPSYSPTTRGNLNSSSASSSVMVSMDCVFISEAKRGFAADLLSGSGCPICATGP